MVPPDPRPRRTLLGNITQLLKKDGRRRANFSKLALRSNAKVPKVYIQEGEGVKKDYPLLGERYILGRSSKSCDIVIRNPVVSQIHASIKRKQGRQFVIKDEGSTNGVFWKKKRVKNLKLRHKDRVSLGPADLENSISLEFYDPPSFFSRLVKTSFYGVTLVSLLVGAAIAWEWRNITVNPLPALQQGPVIILARDRTSLTPERTTAHLENKSLEDYSPHVINALLASEDSRYYWHPGVDPIGTFRALVTNIAGGAIREGGSSVTQQLARSIFRDYVGTEDSLGRKIREAIVALKLETFYSKDFLLLQYLNNVYLGTYANGFEDAARFYFGKPAKDLDISESATLVGILPAPNSFNPVQDYDAAIQYRDRVINRMAQQGKISREDAARARRSRIELSPTAVQQLQSNLAPYYYGYVFDELETLIGTDLVNEGNFIVETGLDVNIQKNAEEALQRNISQTGAALGYSQGAVITLNYRSGEILSMVGGADFSTSQFNRATQALRQPGSTFKLFAYAAAVDQGISPSRAYSCAPLSWQGGNYSGCERASAPSIDMFQGMALSENAIALRVAQDAGLRPTVEMAKKLGIESQLNAVPGLVLGQSEVTLLELSRAYGVVANGGQQVKALAIRKVFDAGDCEDPTKAETCRVIFDQAQQAKSSPQVISSGVANTMTQMLRGVVTGGTGGGASIGLDEVGKTGTTNDGRDLWFVGYVPSRNILTGVWLGNDDNAPTAASSGQAASLWRDLMGRVVR